MKEINCWVVTGKLSGNSGQWFWSWVYDPWLQSSDWQGHTIETDESETSLIPENTLVIQLLWSWIHDYFVNLNKRTDCILCSQDHHKRERKLCNNIFQIICCFELALLGLLHYCR
jgi:hypothetical protein